MKGKKCIYNHCVCLLLLTHFLSSYILFLLLFKCLIFHSLFVLSLGGRGWSYITYTEERHYADSPFSIKSSNVSCKLVASCRSFFFFFIHFFLIFFIQLVNSFFHLWKALNMYSISFLLLSFFAAHIES